MNFDAKLLIPSFDIYLDTEGLCFKAVAIGGSALSIMGIIDRTTRDLDLLTSPIPLAVKNAAISFAKKNSLDPNWLNNEPLDLAQHLPDDWLMQTEPIFLGKALTLYSPCRLHMIFAKFWAMCDRDRDLDDLVALEPTSEEVSQAIEWTLPLDGNSQWHYHVRATADRLLHELQKRGGI